MSCYIPQRLLLLKRSLFYALCYRAIEIANSLRRVEFPFESSTYRRVGLCAQIDRIILIISFLFSTDLTTGNTGLINIFSVI